MRIFLLLESVLSAASHTHKQKLDQGKDKIYLYGITTLPKITNYENETINCNIIQTNES